MSMKKIIMVLLMTIILTALSGCGTESTVTSDTHASTGGTGTSDSFVSSGSTAETTTNREAANKESAEDKWTKIGKTVTVEDIQYTVNGYRYSKGSELFTPEDGKGFLLIDITAKNNSKNSGVISSALTFSLTDADGVEYDISVSGLAAMEDENLKQLDGSIAATASIKGALAYEIPKDTRGLVLTINGILEGKEKIALN
jgi:hypothetical protein